MKTLGTHFFAILLLVLTTTTLNAQETLTRTGLAVSTQNVPEVSTKKPEEIAVRPTNSNEQLSAIEKRLDAVEVELFGSLVPLKRSKELISFLRTNRDVAIGLQEAMAKEVEFNQELLDSLGPAPKEGEPAEALDIKEKRIELTARLVASQGQQQNSSLLISRSAALINKISSEQTEALKESLTKQVQSPLDTSTLFVTWGASTNLWFKITQSMKRWVGEEMTTQRWWSFVVLMTLVLGIGFAFVLPFRRKLISRFGPGQDAKHPSADQKVVAVFAQAVAVGLMPALSAAAVLVPFKLLGVSESPFVEFVSAVVLGVATFLIFRGAIKACLMPESPHWRLWRWTGRAVRRLGRWLLIIAVLVSLYLAWSLLGKSFLIHGYLRNFVTFGLDSLIAISLFIVIRVAVRSARKNRELDDDSVNRQGMGYDWVWSLLLFAVQIACVSIPIFSLLGYVNLANYLTTRLVTSGLLIVIFLLVRGLVFFLIERRKASTSTLSGFDWRHQGTPKDDKPDSWLLLWAEFILAFLVLVIGLNLWGLSSNSLAAWSDQLAVGIKIGDFTFRISDILIGFAAFFAVFILTRIIVWFVSSRLLSRSNFDTGVRHALRSGLSYTGVLVALFVAVSAVGLDLSKLAIVAGALSLGIGFGLQAIVSNFVSGIILLFERPIKIGDWVQVGSVEGTVTKINVRSTEIETFQRATVFVPNSAFISDNVTNWTANNKMGRLDLPISVAYGSDTAQIHDLLVEIAKKNPMVRAYPEPAVYFRAFGGSSLDFELRCFLRDVNYITIVKSELLFDIDKCFRDQGIEVPFATTDINIRSMPFPGQPADDQ